MSWTPRLVALDIDGTLVDHDGYLPTSVKDAVGSVVSAGVPVVMATGRSWPGTKAMVDALGLPPELAVCSNGALVVHTDPFEVVHQALFDPAPVIERVLEMAPNSIIAVEIIGHGYRMNKAFPPDELTGVHIQQSVEELSAQPVSRVIVRDPDADPLAFHELAASLGLNDVEYYVGWSAWLDIAPSGVSKASGLAFVADRLGVAREDVLAIGDGTNDIEMLTWAGRGVAMGDALTVVRDAADAVTATFDQGGTATELRRWF